MTDDLPTLSAPLTIRQLQARLVSELGDEYRYTDRAIRNWITRPQDPLPVARDTTQGRGYLLDWDATLEWLVAEADRREAAQPPDSIASITDGIQVTLRALARELEIHVDTLTNRVRAWNIKPVDNRMARGGPVDYYRLRDLLDALTASARAEDPDSLPALERDAFYRSELRKDELRRNRGELIEIDDARRILGELVAVRRDFYDLLIDVLEHRAGLPPSALDIVQNEIDSVRGREVEAILELQAKLNDQASKAA